ncbi:PfkB family carbohydrate kinase [Jonesiaceae bacterium BS-20]|uniref:PfkB family carbohydrate kinase n=1 Tax=Jonesiaceae bacterium BS-20 TaxID=3120821 RepID=A0AAU7DVS3_9MICO
MELIDQVSFGHVVIDDIELADGTKFPNQLGGAGIYAVVGQALASKAGKAGIVSGMGEDFSALERSLLQTQGIDDRGLVALDAHTPRTRIQYFADGEREETPAHGLAHFEKLDPALAITPQEYLQARGIYVFEALNPTLFGQLADLKQSHNTDILWEIHAGICSPEFFESVVAQLIQVDVLSINRAELQGLCGTTDLIAGVEKLVARTDAVIALRLGSKGAIVLTKDKTYRAQPPAGVVIDPTGAGNAFSGAFVAGYSESNGQPEVALKTAMAASALTIRQYGPPQVTELTRAHMREVAASIEVQISDINALQNGNLL